MGQKRIGNVTDFIRRQARALIDANSWFVRIGVRIDNAYVPVLLGSVKLPELPSITRVDVTISHESNRLEDLLLARTFA